MPSWRSARLRHFPNYIHINDLEDTLTNNNPTNTHKYADDCTIDEVVANGALSNMQESTNQVMNWANDNKMTVNPKKTKDTRGSVFPNPLLNPYKQTELK